MPVSSACGRLRLEDASTGHDSCLHWTTWLLTFSCLELRQGSRPGSSSKTHPRNVTILYLVSSSHSTFTPVSVIWLTLSLKHDSEDSCGSGQWSIQGLTQSKNVYRQGQQQGCSTAMKQKGRKRQEGHAQTATSNILHFGCGFSILSS